MPGYRHRGKRGVGLRQCRQDSGKSLVLFIRVGHVVGSLELNPDRKIIACATPEIIGYPGVPGTLVERYILRDTSQTIDKQMRRHPGAGNFGEIRMCFRIKTVQKQRIHPITAEFPGRQTDTVQYDELRREPRGPRIPVRRLHMTGRADQPGIRIDLHPLPLSNPERHPLSRLDWPR